MLASSARVASADDCRFTTDRPGATNSHVTIGAGCFELESGVSVDRSPGTTGLSFPTLVRFGLVDPLELRLFTGIVSVAVPDGDAAAADATPAALEAKLMGLEAKDAVPGLGALIGVSAPTNSELGSQVTPYTQLLFDWQLTSGLWWSVNGLLSAVPGASSSDPHVGDLGYATVLWLDVPVPGEWLAIYADGAGSSLLRSKSDFRQMVGGGFAFNVVAGAVQLFAGTSVVVTGGEHPFNVSSGVAWQP